MSGTNENRNQYTNINELPDVQLFFQGERFVVGKKNGTNAEYAIYNNHHHQDLNGDLQGEAFKRGFSPGQPFVQDPGCKYTRLTDQGTKNQCSHPVCGVHPNVFVKVIFPVGTERIDQKVKQVQYYKDQKNGKKPEISVSVEDL
jgi:hypothetical protein